jgi:hypothetical protein
MGRIVDAERVGLAGRAAIAVVGAEKSYCSFSHIFHPHWLLYLFFPSLQSTLVRFIWRALTRDQQINI